MKKKLKDLTLGEVKKIHLKHFNQDKEWCDRNCPLWELEHICGWETPELTNEDLDQEVEMEE
jgi:hypothetical protein